MGVRQDRFSVFHNKYCFLYNKNSKNALRIFKNRYNYWVKCENPPQTSALKAAAEWAKPSRSAAALRRRACGISISDILRRYSAYTVYCVYLRPGTSDPDFQLCVFLVHICKLLRKVAFFSKWARRRQILPLPAAKIWNDQVGLVALLKIRLFSEMLRGVLDARPLTTWKPSKIEFE